MRQTIRFCKARDGVQLAYAITGEGPPLVKAANWLTHLEYDWESPVWRDLIDELSREHTLVRYDARGNGLSDWDAETITPDSFVDDLETVIEAAGLDHFALLGISQGAAASIAYCVRHPERVTHLVLHGGYARGWRKRSAGAEAQRQQALLTLMQQGWGQDNPAFRQVFTSLFIPDATPEQIDWFNQLERHTTSPENAVRIRRATGEIDVTSLLEHVSVPALVMHSRNDAVVPFECGRELAGAIPGARFVPLETRNHLILRQERAWSRFVAEIRAFVRDADAPDSDWSKVDDLLDQALDKPEDERSDWLLKACGSNPSLRQQVERLIELASSKDDRLQPSGAAAGPLWQAVAQELAFEGEDDGDGGLSGGGREPGAGHIIGGYEILSVIGRGGMGTVYRARNPRLDREVALKALAADFHGNPRALKRFEREAKILANLQHPNIAVIHDAILENGKPYLVLELLDGETLLEKLQREGALPLEAALSITRTVADAVAYAHERGVVHRDLKPANIMLTTSGAIKVLDFGLARPLATATATATENVEAQQSPASATTLAGALLGTPNYMSPEQARSEQADERADIWALGCILLEALSGARAFGERTAAETLASVLRDPAPIDLLPAEVPPHVVDVVRRCLDKDKDHRPGSMRDVAEALTSSDRAQTPERRSRSHAFWAILAIVITALIVTLFLTR